MEVEYNDDNDEVWKKKIAFDESDPIWERTGDL